MTERHWPFWEFHPALLRTVADILDECCACEGERAEELRHFAALVDTLIPPTETPVTRVEWSDEPPVIGIYPKSGCYEAMDEPDPIITDGYGMRLSRPATSSVIIGGNFGLPCA